MVVETLSKAVAEVAAKLKNAKKIEPFDQRDLRRTAETMLQKLGVDREVRAHLLSHGRNQGVQGCTMSDMTSSMEAPRLAQVGWSSRATHRWQANSKSPQAPSRVIPQTALLYAEDQSAALKGIAGGNKRSCQTPARRRSWTIPKTGVASETSMPPSSSVRSKAGSKRSRLVPRGDEVR
jgi:hypothetical protein